MNEREEKLNLYKKYRRALAFIMAMGATATMASSSLADGDTNGTDYDSNFKLYVQESVFTPMTTDNDAKNDNVTTYISFDDAVRDGLNYLLSPGEAEGDLRRQLECAISITARRLCSVEIIDYINRDEKFNKDMTMNVVNRILSNNTLHYSYAQSPSELDRSKIKDSSKLIYSEQGHIAAKSIDDNLFGAMVETKVTTKCGKVVAKPNLSKVLTDVNSFYNRVYEQLTGVPYGKLELVGPSVLDMDSLERWFVRKIDGVGYDFITTQLLLNYFERALLEKYCIVGPNQTLTLRDDVDISDTRPCLDGNGNLKDECMIRMILNRWVKIREIVYETSENEINTILGIGICDNTGKSIIERRQELFAMGLINPEKEVVRGRG